MAIFFPADSEMLRLGWECHPKPEIRLGQQPKTQRFAKKQSDYQRRKTEMRAGWGGLVDGMRLTEAMRFQGDFRIALRNIAADGAS